MRKLLLFMGIMALVVAGVQPLGAATDTKGVTVQVTFTASAKLTVGSTTVSFADLDPDAAATLPALEGPISITAKARTGAAGAVTLTLQAATDLTSGTDTIAISNVSWTHTGANYLDGAMSTSAVNVASWTGPGSFSGTQSFSLANSWSYKTGVYTASATYTLTAP